MRLKHYLLIHEFQYISTVKISIASKVRKKKSINAYILFIYLFKDYFEYFGLNYSPSTRQTILNQKKYY